MAEFSQMTAQYPDVRAAALPQLWRAKYSSGHQGEARRAEEDSPDNQRGRRCFRGGYTQDGNRGVGVGSSAGNRRSWTGGRSGGRGGRGGGGGWGAFCMASAEIAQPALVVRATPVCSASFPLLARRVFVPL